jgi:hypothetical protein
MTTMDFNTRTEYFIEQINKGEYVPDIYNTIAKVGADNLFYITKNYRGLYQDDDCTFTYWDNVNGKVVTDSWTTAAYCPNFNLYTHNIITFKSAVEQGLVNMNLVYKYSIELLRSRAKYILSTIKTVDSKFHPIVKVSGGRKWKGTGFLVSVESNTYSYGPTYGKGCNQTTTTTAKILSIEDMQIHYVNNKYVEIVGLNDFINDFSNYMNSVIDEIEKNPKGKFENPTTNPNLTLIDMKFMDFDEFMKGKYPNIDNLIMNAYDPVEEERKRKFSEQKSNDFARLMEWVENKTDKTTDLEKVKLTINVMNKPKRY